MLLLELKGVGKKGTFLCSCDWLDVVLPRDGLLQKEMGRGSEDSSAKPAQPSGLPRKLLGIFVKSHRTLYSGHFTRFQVFLFLYFKHTSS